MSETQEEYKGYIVLRLQGQKDRNIDLPGDGTEVTVREILDELDIDLSGKTVTLNGNPVGMDTVLQYRDRINVAKDQDNG